MPAAENGRTGRPRKYPEVILTEPGQKTFKVLPRRRVVERTFAWPMKYRRLRDGYENTVSSSRAWILLAVTSLMARRLRPA
jgi:transposase